MSDAGKSVLDGLRDALAYARGDVTRGRTWKPRVEDIDVQAVRRRLKMTQAEFSTLFAVRLDTVQNWEQGRRRPEGPALVLLNVIDREPVAVYRALRKAGTAAKRVHAAPPSRRRLARYAVHSAKARRTS